MLKPGPITYEEMSWARTCLKAGDSLQLISAWSGRSVDEWESLLEDDPFTKNTHPLEKPERNADIGKRIRAGESCAAIGRSLGISSRRVREIALKLRARRLL